MVLPEWRRRNLEWIDDFFWYIGKFGNFEIKDGKVVPKPYEKPKVVPSQVELYGWEKAR